jgi:hypothetical protein
LRSIFDEIINSPLTFKLKPRLYFALLKHLYGLNSEQRNYRVLFGDVRYDIILLIFRFLTETFIKKINKTKFKFFVFTIENNVKTLFIIFKLKN